LISDERNNLQVRRLGAALSSDKLAMKPDMRFSFAQTLSDQSGDKSPHSKVADEEMVENDVNYGIADCRRRLRSQRSSLRAQYHPPKIELGEPSPAAAAEQLEERGEAVIT
jgi:hypothetical protein